MEKKSNAVEQPSFAKPSAERSAIMRAIRSKDTKPEIAVRSMLHRMDYRFRLHRKGLSGRPDIFLKRHNLAIFVNGFFWHRHANCRLAGNPKSNVAFWQDKFSRAALKRAGLGSLVLWEYQVRKSESAPEFIGDADASPLDCHAPPSGGSQGRFSIHAELSA